MAVLRSSDKNLVKYITRIFLFIVLLIVICENYLLNCSLLEQPGMPEGVQAVSDDPAYLQGWRNAASNAEISCDDSAILETIDEDGKRATPLVNNPKYYAAFLGCSYAYGMGVRDNETFIWKIAEQLPYVQCDNYGVSGYGTQQCCTWLAHLNYERLHGKDKYHYDKIFYIFIADHLNRNYEFRFSKNKTSNIVVLPRAEIKKGKILYHGLETLYWPGCDRFAMIIFFRNLYANFLLLGKRDLLHESFIKNEQGLKKGQEAVFNGIIADMLRISENYGAEFYLVYLDRNVDNIIDPELKRNGLHTVDIVYDNIYSYKSRVRCLPDHHPNADVHKYWADSFVRQMKDKF